MSKVKGLLWILGLCLSYGLQAQSVDVRLKLNKDRIQLGDAIQMDVSATYDPQQFVVHFPRIPDTVHGFEILHREKPDTVFKRSVNEYHQRFVITHFDSGRWVIPPFLFDIESKKGEPSQQKQTDSVWVEVGTPVVDTSKPIKPITDVRGAEKPWQDIALEIGAYVLGALGLILLLYFLWKRYTRWKENKNKIPPAPVFTPVEQALRDLEKIKTEALFTKGEEKTYHTQLTDVLRSYLEQQFGIDSFEKTTSEIMQIVKKHKALANSRQALRHVLETADMVKFAKSMPTVEEHEACLAMSEEIVRESFKKFQNQQTTAA